MEKLTNPLLSLRHCAKFCSAQETPTRKEQRTFYRLDDRSNSSL
jgi:hypothetical protein